MTTVQPTGFSRHIKPVSLAIGALAAVASSACPAHAAIYRYGGGGFSWAGGVSSNTVNSTISAFSFTVAEGALASGVYALDQDVTVANFLNSGTANAGNLCGGGNSAYFTNTTCGSKTFNTIAYSTAGSGNGYFYLFNNATTRSASTSDMLKLFLGADLNSSVTSYTIISGQICREDSATGATTGCGSQRSIASITGSIVVPSPTPLLGLLPFAAALMARRRKCQSMAA